MNIRKLLILTAVILLPLPSMAQKIISQEQIAKIAKEANFYLSPDSAEEIIRVENITIETVKPPKEMATQIIDVIMKGQKSQYYITATEDFKRVILLSAKQSTDASRESSFNAYIAQMQKTAAAVEKKTNFKGLQSLVSRYAYTATFGDINVYSKSSNNNAQLLYSLNSQLEQYGIERIMDFEREHIINAALKSHPKMNLTKIEEIIANMLSTGVKKPNYVVLQTQARMLILEKLYNKAFPIYQNEIAKFDRNYLPFGARPDSRYKALEKVLGKDMSKESAKYLEYIIKNTSEKDLQKIMKNPKGWAESITYFVEDRVQQINNNTNRKILIGGVIGTAILAYVVDRILKYSEENKQIKKLNQEYQSYINTISEARGNQDYSALATKAGFDEKFADVLYNYAMENFTQDDAVKYYASTIEVENTAFKTLLKIAEDSRA